LTERTDTRVLQIIYEIVGDADTLWPGQQLDVLIQDNRQSPTFQPAPGDKVVKRQF